MHRDKVDYDKISSLLWRESKRSSATSYACERGLSHELNNRLDCHAIARNDEKNLCHPEFNLGSINVDKRLCNKCAMTWNSDIKENIFTDTVFSRFTSHFSLKSAAFTLAEVLITLGIIGVVAAMTMPTLINNINKKHWIAGYKKAYSELSQIHQLLNSETGGSYMAECNDFDDVCLKNLFAEKMKVVESCKGDIPNKCQEKSTYLDGSTWNQASGSVNINDNKWP